MAILLGLEFTYFDFIASTWYNKSNFQVVYNFADTRDMRKMRKYVQRKKFSIHSISILTYLHFFRLQFFLSFSFLNVILDYLKLKIKLLKITISCLKIVF